MCGLIANANANAITTTTTTIAIAIAAMTATDRINEEIVAALRAFNRPCVALPM